MKTISEKLQDKLGSKVMCDYCKKKKTFNSNWKMSKGSTVVCPDCQPEVLSKGGVLVSI